MIERPAVIRAFQIVFVLGVLWFGGGVLIRQWAEVRELGLLDRTNWAGVGMASTIVGLSYAVLIATWRATVRAWGERIGVADAAYIWFVSNLGKYVPGKVWQISAMGVLAQRAGVAPLAAVGSALVVSIIHVLVGFVVVGATGAQLLRTSLPSGPVTVIVLLGLGGSVLATPWLLPPLVRVASRVTGRELGVPELPPRAIWIAAAGSAVAWLMFGVAFRVLTAALIGTASGSVSAYISVFTLSYLLGFLAIFAPGGIGVREGFMFTLLGVAGLATAAEATWLVIGSRLWLTVLEIIPGALLLALPLRTFRRVPPTAP